MLNFASFQNKFINDIQLEFPNSSVSENNIEINTDTQVVYIPLNAVYEDYKNHGQYKKTLNEYIRTTKDLLNQYKFDLNYDIIFPIIKTHDFAENEPANFHRKNLFLDLDLLYVSDMGEMFRFITTGDLNDNELLHNKALNNLNKLANKLVPIHDNLEIYTLAFNCDLAPSMLLNDTVFKQIIKSVGTTFLFSVPTSSTLLIAKDYPGYVNILKELITTDTDPYKVSDRIYRYKHGDYEFADIESNNLKKFLY